MTTNYAARSSEPLDVLLVEPDTDFARRVDAALDGPSSGFRVVRVPTPAAALEALGRSRFDILLVDFQASEETDTTALAAIRAAALQTPLIVLTGHEDERGALGALHQGAEDYLVKSRIDRPTLIRSVRYAIERHRSIRDLSLVTEQLREANVRLEQLALIDPLTELLNRRGLQQALSQEIDRVRRDRAEVMVILIDIDDFKRVNDTLGHSVGDVALKQVARKLKGSVRGSDHVARLGGDEFMLLLPGVKPGDVPRIAERLRLGLATTTIQVSTGIVRLTASLGVTMLSSDTPSIDELVSKSHQILRRSKELGRNRVSIEGDFDDTERRGRNASDICAAIARGERIVSVRQPIVRLSDGATVGMEFLSRVDNGTLEMPDSFFRMCTEHNLLTLADHQCLRSALSAAADLAPDTRAHLNLFPSTILSVPPQHILEDFPSRFPDRHFCIEISEQQILGESSHLIGPVRQLREGGMLIAIDDVGYGNSCVESLVLLEPDVIKIDKRCVKGIASDSTQRRNLERYLGIAGQLAAEVVAEGIEGQDDLRALRDMGVEYGQGFLWGKPE